MTVFRSLFGRWQGWLPHRVIDQAMGGTLMDYIKVLRARMATVQHLPQSASKSHTQSRAGLHRDDGSPTSSDMSSEVDYIDIMVAVANMKANDVNESAAAIGSNATIASIETVASYATVASTATIAPTAPKPAKK